MDKDDQFQAASTNKVNRKENAAQGHFYWFISLFCQLVLATSINALYGMNPKLQVMELLVLRGVISTLVMAVLLFGKIKATLYDGV
jgi:hypothetical protein